MATSDLRTDSGVTDRKAFNAALDELQAAMLVVPEGVYYEPKFTYIWTLGLSRFPDALTQARQARCRRQGNRALFSQQRRVDHSRRARAGDRIVAPEAGLGNRALVKEGFATMLAPGWYQLRESFTAPSQSLHD